MVKGSGVNFACFSTPFLVRVKVSRFGVWGIGVKFEMEWVDS